MKLDCFEIFYVTYGQTVFVHRKRIYRSDTNEKRMKCIKLTFDDDYIYLILFELFYCRELRLPEHCLLCYSHNEDSDRHEQGLLPVLMNRIEDI